MIKPIFNPITLLYPLLVLIIPLCGAKFSKKGSWNEEFFSLEQTKMMQGFFAICIMLHHIGQKTAASWLPPNQIIHGLDAFVEVGYYFVGIFLFCSGYGLFKSWKTKPGYLEGFFKKRVLPLILGFYSTGIIFLIVRLAMGEKMGAVGFIFYLTGIKLSNPNTWYVIAMPFFYLGFYLGFRFLKKENAAVLFTVLWVFGYTLLGTFIDHNDFWMRGQWWYNSAHFFVLGILFAKNETAVVEKVKRHYVLFLILAFISIFLFYHVSMFVQGTVSYYGEFFDPAHKVIRRWGCLLSQILASCSFVFFVFMLGLKVKLGNKVLAFMGSITLEFYLIHGLFVELFAHTFCDAVPGLYVIKNVPLYIVAVAVPGVPCAVLLQKFHGLILGKKSKQTKGGA